MNQKEIVEVGDHLWDIDYPEEHLVGVMILEMNEN